MTDRTPENVEKDVEFKQIPAIGEEKCLFTVKRIGSRTAARTHYYEALRPEEALALHVNVFYPGDDLDGMRWEVRRFVLVGTFIVGSAGDASDLSVLKVE